MIQSAFRNILNTQYKEGKRIVTRAYLSYEEVFAQIKKDFCDEEANILIAYMFSTKFPTREQQFEKSEARERRALKRFKEKEAQKPKITIEDVIKANEQFIPKTGKPVMWNGQSPDQVKSKRILRVKE